jgi:hypothetical protein
MTTSVPTVGSRRQTAASVLRQSKWRPPYQYPSTATNTFGAIWPNRSTMPSAPKSGEHDDQTAPIDAAPSAAMTASAVFGTMPATRSPSLTPACESAAAALPTSARSSPNDSRRLRPRSVVAMIAGAWSGPPSRFRVKLSRPSGKNRAPGIRSRSMAWRSPREPAIPQ